MASTSEIDIVYALMEGEKEFWDGMEDFYYGMEEMPGRKTE